MELFVLGLVAGLFFASYALWNRSRKAHLGDAARRTLPPVERTLKTLQVGDVVSHLGTDYLVEGVVQLDEDGQTSLLYRLHDGTVERHLAVRPGDDSGQLLRERPELQPLASGTDGFMHDGVPYRLDSRASARVVRGGPGRPEETLHVYAYVGPGTARILTLDWQKSGRVEVLHGERVAAESFDLLPGR